MTTVRTRAREISNREGFDVEVLRKGKPVRLSRNGAIGPWPHRNKTSGSKTVQDFEGKFAKAHPGYSCRVFDGDGYIVHGNKLLKNVRATY